MPSHCCLRRQSPSCRHRQNLSRQSRPLLLQSPPFPRLASKPSSVDVPLVQAVVVPLVSCLHRGFPVSPFLPPVSSLSPCGVGAAPLPAVAPTAQHDGERLGGG
ncbi:hypothetical protein PIB30_069536 [Stylosanthes scabra]|uniref:Uncharacterized protein n=1 Tax=Stylosanthes scabra TaxID=79078 RepID=A0ABU6WP81_9FABA|nr:hypothetical protein [Stylosanthes scabra]